jgi:sugar lactone lactonase YvrE
MNALKVSRVATSFLACCLSSISFAATNPKMEIFAGSGAAGSAGDNGPASQAQLNGPTGIAQAFDGSLYICDTENHRIRRVTADGTITTVAGTGERGWSGDGGPATNAKLNEPYEVRFDKAGNVFWVERMNHLVRKMDRKTGQISTVAGSGSPGFSGDGGPATQARLSEPHSIGFDNHDDLYICDVKNHRIRKMDMRTGIISTFAGTGEGKPTPDHAPIAGTPLHGPRALDFDQAGNLWLALREGNMILKLDLANGLIHRVAGTGKKGFTGDNGPATQATLAGPKGLSVGPNGNVYFADTENHAVRMIDTKSGKLLLIAGTGIKGTAFDSDPLKCTLARPHGIFVATDGSIFIGDTEANRIELIRSANRP